MRLFYGIMPLVVLAACTLGPDYKRPDFWSDADLSSGLMISGKNYPISVFWYQAFGDETLNCLIGEVLRNNSDVKIAQSRLRQARHSLNITEVEYLPMFNAAGNYNYSYAPKYEELGDKTSYYRLGLDASWELDIFGGGRRKTESSKALYRSAADNLNNVLLSMTAETANNYILLKTVQEQIHIAQENLKLQQDILQTVQNKYKAGMADEAALNQAEYAVHETKSLIPDLQYNEKAYINAIAVLRGKMPENNEEFSYTKDNLVTNTFSFDMERLSEFPLEAVRERPDVKLSENMLIAKNAEIGVAIANMFPNISISAALGWQGHLVRDWGRSENAAYGYGPTINMPFFHWGELINQVKLSKEVKNEYVYTYRKVLLEAIAEIRNSMIAVGREYEKNDILQKSADNAEKVLLVMKVKYEQGLIEFGDLLTSEQNLLSAQNNLVLSQSAIYQKIISFYKAVGGGYYSYGLRR